MGLYNRRFLALIALSCLIFTHAFSVFADEDTQQNYSSALPFINTIHGTNANLPINVPEQKGNIGEFLTRIFVSDVGSDQGKIKNWFLKVLGTRSDGRILRWVGASGGKLENGTIYDDGTNVSIGGPTISGTTFNVEGDSIFDGDSAFEGDIDIAGDIYKNGSLVDFEGKFVDGTDTDDAVYTTGNVGIGLLNPANTLTVSENVSGDTFPVRVQNPDGGSNKIGIELFNSGQGSAIGSHRTGTNGGADLFFSTYNSGGNSTEVMRINENLNVGIGTASPSTGLKLDVEGKVGATEYCDENGGNCFDPSSVAISSSGTLLGGSGTANYISKFTGSGTTIGDSLIYDTGTNIGIGTATPGSVLEVAGSVIATGPVTDGNHLTTKNYVDTLVSGGVSWKAPVPTGSTPVVTYGACDAAKEGWATYNIDDDIVYLCNATAWVSIGSTASVPNATTTTAGKVQIAGDIEGTWNNIRLKDGVVDSANIENNTIVAGDIATGAVGTAEVLNGSIIDNDVSPTAAISGSKINPSFGSQTLTAGLVNANGGVRVDGNTMISTGGDAHTARFSTASRYGYFQGYNSLGDRGYYLGYGNGGSEVDLFLDTADTFKVSGGNFSVDSGNVNTVARFSSTDAGAAIGLSDDTTTNAVGINAVGDVLGFLSGPTSSRNMVLDGSGDVGIGTTTPGAKLEVVGSVIATGPVTDGSHLTTKNYVDTLVSAGVSWKAPVPTGSTPVGTYGACDAAKEGWATYNIDDDIVYLCNASAWVSIGSTASVPNATTTTAGKVQIAGDIEGTWNNIRLKDGVVDSANIENNTIVAGDIAAGAVGTVELAPNSIETTRIINNSIGSADIGPNAVGTSEVENNSITSDDLATGSVGTAEILNGSIIDNDVSPTAAISGSKINPNFGTQTLTAGQVNANGGLTVDGNTMISTGGDAHTARFSTASRYGYFQGYNSLGDRGYYLGYGNGGSEVDLFLDTADTFKVSGGNFSVDSGNVNTVARFSSTDAGATIGLSDDTTTNAVGISAIGDTLGFLSGPTSLRNMVLSGSGNLGVGTVTPGSKLTVVSDDNTLAGIKNQTNGVDSLSVISITNDAINWQLRNDGINGDTFNIRNATSGVDVFSASTAGNVGIGKYIPTEQFVVSGDGNFEFGMASIDTMARGVNGMDDGLLTVDGDMFFQVDDDSTQNAAFKFYDGTENEIFVINENGIVEATGRIKADEPQVGNDLTTKNYVDTLVSAGVSWKAPVPTGSTPAGTYGACDAAKEGWATYNIDDNIVYLCNASAWVSIGSTASVPNATTTTAGKVQIAGDIEGTWNNIRLKDGVVDSANIVDATITSADITNNTITSDDLATDSVGTAEILNGSIINNDISSTAAISGSKINPNFGTQAIGVNGKTVVTANGVAHSSHFTDDTKYGFFQGLNNSGDIGFVIGNGNGSGSIDFLLDAASKMFLKGGDMIVDTGNIGIGTNNLGERLVVDGNIQVEKNGSKVMTFYNTNSIASSPDIDFDENAVLSSEANFYINLDSDNNNAGGESFVVASNLGNINADEIFRVQANGRVGIGSGSPSAKLDINAGGTSDDLASFDMVVRDESPSILFHDDNGGTGNQHKWIIGESGGHLRFAFSDNNVLGNFSPLEEHFIITDTGNVGIGTSSPGSALEVAGRISAYTPIDPDHVATKFYVDSQTANNATTTSSGVIQIAGDIQGTYDNIVLKANVVEGINIVNSTITSDDILNNTLTSNDIGTAAVGGNELALDVVSSAHIIDASITSDDILDNTLTADDIDSDAIGGNELASDSVAGVHIIDSSIIDVDISASAAISGTKINPNFGSQALSSGDMSGQKLTLGANASGTVADIDLTGNAIVSTDDTLYIIGNSDNSNTAGEGIIFGTSSLAASGISQHMRILRNGRIGIGVNVASEQLEVGGNVKGTSFINSSDRRLKKNITSVPGLSHILRLRGVMFDWKEDNVASIGFIAQEVEEVFPEIVKTDINTGMKAVQYSALIAPLVEAVKEQQVLIEDSQKEIELLKQEIGKLRNK